MKSYSWSAKRGSQKWRTHRTTLLRQPNIWNILVGWCRLLDFDQYSLMSVDGDAHEFDHQCGRRRGYIEHDFGLQHSVIFVALASRHSGWAHLFHEFDYLSLLSVVVCKYSHSHCSHHLKD